MLSALLALYTLAQRRQATAALSLHYHYNIAQRHGDDREAFVDAGLEAKVDEAAFERAAAGQIWVANMGAYRKFTQIAWSIRALVVEFWPSRPWPSPEMLLLILMVAFAAVALVSFFGGGRTSNRTIWIVVGAFLLVGLLLIVGAHSG